MADSPGSATEESPPLQLAQIVEAVTCLRENITVLCSGAEPPTAQEVAELATRPCEVIIRNLRAAMVAYTERTTYAERYARTQVGAEIMALLHVPDL